MLKRIIMAAVVVAAFALVAGTPDTADAGWRHRRVWHRRPVLVGPPVVVRHSYYPARYYYPYRFPYRPYWGPRFYGRGVHVSVGW